MGDMSMGVGNDKTAGACKYQECRFIKSNGLKCQSPAMRGSQFCYFHGRTRIYVARPRSRKPLQLPPLQNHASVHVALTKFSRRLPPGTSTRSAPAICFMPCRWRSKPSTLHHPPRPPRGRLRPLTSPIFDVPFHRLYIGGRSGACFVVIAIFAGSMCTCRTFTSATISIVPAVFVDCTITCARPLKSERLRLLVALLAVGIAVAHADERAFAGDLEADEIVRPWARGGPPCPAPRPSERPRPRRRR